MLKKRIIFTLLYEDGFFIQSRNFRRQKIGNEKWINKNYNFNYISNFIDELIILDISKKKNRSKFYKICKLISNKVFVPISLGGGINSYEDAKSLFMNGADKVVINTCVFKNYDVVEKISQNFGASSIIISIDVKKLSNKYYVFIENGNLNTELELKDYLKRIHTESFSEIYLNSIDRDGTGYGVDLKLLSEIKKFNYKYIITGGLGNSKHFYDVFKKKKKVEAISTANLLNFIGDSLKEVRKNLINKKINLSKRINNFK